MNKFTNSSGGACPKSGIKIHKHDNDYKKNPFACNYNNNNNNNQNFQNNQNNQNFQNNQNNKSLQIIDLNIDNYSREDLYKLFGISNIILTDEVMKETKKIVLKTHPDKSKLDPKYFLFYSQAYKRLYSIYEFQNKSTKNRNNTNYVNERKNEELKNEENENNLILKQMFNENKNLETPENFNKWFNEAFNKYKLKEESDQGYGEWLKSDEGISNVSNISKADMNLEFEKQKKHIQTLNVYKGIHETYLPRFCGTELMERNDNFSSGNIFSNSGMGYTDLKQAYVESIIPVTEEDYNNVKKFKNVEEYKNYRNNVDITPLQKEEAERKLYYEKQKLDEENVALAFHYAKQTEKSIENNKSFWASLKQLK